MRYFTFIILFFTLLNTSCSKKDTTIDIEKAAIYFDTVPADSSGITFSNDLHYTEDINIIEYLYYYNGGGVAIGDINNDGLEDVFFTANQKPDKLYLNLGNLKFKDITESSGIIIDSTWSTGVTMEDVNNDGFLDIYVSKVSNYKGLTGHNLLYINNGDNTFSELSTKYGLDFSGFSTQASFFDYDNDGDMDMYLLNHSIHTPRSYGKINKRKATDSLAGDRFYENTLNEGNFNFKEVSSQTGIFTSALGYGLGLVTVDINQDGYIDIYVGNDFHENDYLYINQGDKTFKESNANFLNHTSRFTMGVDIADINNDSKVDIFTLDMMPFNHELFLKSGGEDSDNVSIIKKNFGYQTQYARNNFQLNTGNSSFSEIAVMTNTHATDWSWSVLLEDYDNDGLIDIFTTNGIFKRPNDLDYIKYLSNINFSKYDQNQLNEIEKKLIDEMPSLNIPNIVFRNKGDLEFERTSNTSGLLPSYSNGAAYGDLDNDGDLDLIINNINQPATLLENKSSEGANNNNHIVFSLKGDRIIKNTSGTKLYLYRNGKEYYKEQISTKGFESSSSRKLHFGLGNETKVDSLKIIWLDGSEQTEYDLTINQINTISKKSTHLNKKSNKEQESYTLFPFIHIEDSYNDYSREPLIPEKLSTEGPAVVHADFNGDGLKDLYLGGAKYQKPKYFIKTKKGNFIPKQIHAFNKDESFEDVDAVAFDLENDGDMDLYVMSGGNDMPQGDSHLEDRIYINDGKGNFEKLDAQLPATNGGSISVGDYNKDGYDDLFIGARSVPGVYGASPISLILKNTGKGNFEVVAQHELGMITDSKWADINNDTFLDLILVGDWMPITVLLNDGNGRFINNTRNLGLEKTSGLWNTVTVSDINKDGNPDIIAGNTGLNFKWKASIANPVKMYLDDFDENSQIDPIIFYNFFGHYVPFASKDNLANQLPYLKKKFLSYKKFSEVNGIEDLIEKPVDSILNTKEIQELRSMVYLNTGTKFNGVALPKEAQMSSIEDFYINEESQSVYYVGNFSGYVTELGNSSANSGGVLSGFTTDGFTKVDDLSIPKHLNARKIIEINKNTFLVISNNDKSYTIQIK